MLVVLEDSLVKHKVINVRPNMYSEYCWFCYIVSYVTARVWGHSLMIYYKQIKEAAMLSKNFNC